MEFIFKDYHKNVTKDELITDTKKVYRISNVSSFSYDTYRKNGGKYSDRIVYKLFESWIDLLKICDITPSKRQLWLTKNKYKPPIKTEDIINDIKKVANLLKKESITTTDYAKYGNYCVHTAIHRFGSWNKSLEKSQLKPFEVVRGKRISEKELLQEIEKMWLILGRQPVVSDIKNGYSKYSLHAYQRRFGSWLNALRFFVFYVDFEKDKKSNVDIGNYLSLSSKSSNIPKRKISLKTRFEVMQRDNFKCCKCGRSANEYTNITLEIDHIQPISKGGSNEINNLQTLCNECNMGKRNSE